MFDKLTVRQAQTLSRLLGQAYDDSMTVCRQRRALWRRPWTTPAGLKIARSLADQAAMRQEFTQLRWMLADRISHA